MDYLAEKVDKCSLNENCSLYKVAGCLLFRGCLSIEVNGRTVGTFKIVHYIMCVCCCRYYVCVSAVEECPLGGFHCE